MHPDFLPYLVCPKSGRSLALHITQARANGMVETGTLSSEGGPDYPIVRGVPRFVDRQQYTRSFGYEWHRWPRVQFEAQNAGGPMAGHTTRMWQAVTAASEEETRGQTIVEFGCGPGRFLDIVRRRGGRAVGIDMSQAVDAARTNFANDPQVLIVQGDINCPPFRPDSFDGGYTIGVLHHTPSPVQGLGMLARCVKPGGWVACSVYDKNGLYDFPSVAVWRRICNGLTPLLGYRPALAYAWFSALMLGPLAIWGQHVPILRRVLACLWRFGLVVVPLPDYRWRLLDAFDAITPTIATSHTAEEVEAWMKAADCVQVGPRPWGSTSFRGLRRVA
jgi:SAM-dependent methyltransferase